MSAGMLNAYWRLFLLGSLVLLVIGSCIPMRLELTPAQREMVGVDDWMPAIPSGPTPGLSEDEIMHMAVHGGDPFAAGRAALDREVEGFLGSIRSGFERADQADRMRLANGRSLKFRLWGFWLLLFLGTALVDQVKGRKTGQAAASALNDGPSTPGNDPGGQGK